MVTPANYHPSSEAGRRYSRACPPYHIPYSDNRRFHLSSHDARTATMAEREADSESSQPRKRIAVACGRCRKRKIRCSGDPGNGLPCSNCKNAGYEPCLFLRVSSTETQLRNDGSDFGYNLEAARSYSNQTRMAVPQLNSMSQYPTDMTGGDVMTSYRQNQYPYGSKSCYSTMPGWSGTYPDDGVDYSLNYAYPMLNQDPAHMVQNYGRYGSGKSVYVEPEASYSYGNLVHRPAVNSDSPTGFTMSGMAASLPNAPDRVVPSDRLLPQVNRTLTGSSSYRADALPGHYSSSKTSPTSTMSEVGYSGLNSSFEPPYSTSSTLPSSISHRSASHHDNTTYQSGAGSTSEAIYASGEQSLRSAEDSNSNLSYIYSDSKSFSSRRDSQSSGGASTGSVLPNGHVYVPESHHAHAPSQSYVVSGASASHGSGVDGATASASRGSGSSGSSHVRADGHRRSAGNLRGG
ncbi:hypothetical protein F4779DRAFT_127976 [Xylariaceae sp. FL0662B]|nr:hypothetical protein F4779DRAFT_127976 [Xylariaceae sp. FL0662B]